VFNIEADLVIMCLTREPFKANFSHLQILNIDCLPSTCFVRGLLQCVKALGSCRLKHGVGARVTTVCLHCDHHCCSQTCWLDNVCISFPLSLSLFQAMMKPVAS
jgi:hypothetical protein